MSESNLRRPKLKVKKQVSATRKHTRRYTNRTVSLLFGLSGNRCAHPDCIHKIIENYTEFDDTAIVGHIAHIYSGSKIGPRSYVEAGFDPKLLNSFENLILLCRHHHGIIDSQSNTYTAEQILSWKENHLVKNLTRRVSLLREQSAHHSIFGFLVDAFMVDARLIQVGIPDKKVAVVGYGSQKSQVVHTYTPYTFELDNGHQYTMVLRNSQFMCAIGNRIAILGIRTEHKTEHPYCIYDYHSSVWTNLPNPDDINLVREIENEIGGIVMFGLLPLLLMMLWFGSSVYNLSVIGTVFLIAVLIRSIGLVRKTKLRRIVNSLQSSVEFR